MGDGNVWRTTGGCECVTAGRRRAEDIAGGCTENAVDTIGETASSRESGRFFVIFLAPCLLIIFVLLVDGSRTFELQFGPDKGLQVPISRFDFSSQGQVGDVWVGLELGSVSDILEVDAVVLQLIIINTIVRYR